MVGCKNSLYSIKAHAGRRMEWKKSYGKLSFENVDHLSSAALGMLITLNQKVGERNGRLILSDIQANIYQVFRITRLNKLFEICESAKVALGKF